MAQGLAASLEAFDGDIAVGVLRELRLGWNAEHVLTSVRQARIAEASNRIAIAQREGVGQLTMRIDPHAYHYWGQREGYDCWKDKQFRDEFKRDNPEVRVKGGPAKTTILVDKPGTLNRKPETSPGIVAATRRGTILPC